MSVWVITTITSDDVIVHVVCKTEAQMDAARGLIAAADGKDPASLQIDERPDDWDCPDPDHRTFRRPPIQ